MSLPWPAQFNSVLIFTLISTVLCRNTAHAGSQQILHKPLTLGMPDIENVPAPVGAPIIRIPQGNYSFYTPHGQRSLEKLEWKIFARIKYLYWKHRNVTTGTFTDVFEKENQDILTYLKDFQKSYGIASLEHSADQPPQMVEIRPLNPLKAYKMVARFLFYINVWTTVTPSPRDKFKFQLTSFLRKTYNISDALTFNELQRAMFFILKLHHIHDLAVKNIARGCMVGICKETVLNARDCFQIGKFGVSLKLFTIGIEWLEHALYLVQELSDKSVRYEDIYDELATSELLHDDGHKQTELDDYNVFNEPLREVRESSMRVTRKSLMQRNTSAMATDRYFDVKHWEICKGKMELTDRKKSKLFCWYEQEIHPSFKIGPIKAELHSMYPESEVVQYHDIISDIMVEEIKNFSYPRFAIERGNVSSYQRYGLECSACLVRIGSVKKQGPEALKKTINLVERILGLQTSGRVNILAHVPGFSIRQHRDHYVDTILGTFLFYLSDVERGGETAFIDGGFKVFPTKGSGIFWHNYYSCESRIKNSKHASCPVIFGERWFGTTDFLYHKQDHLLCHPEPNKIHETLVNGKSKLKIPLPKTIAP